MFRRDLWDSLICGMSLTRVYMEFNFLNIQIVNSQLCLWISNFFSSNMVLKYKVRQTEIFVILGYFLPFQPPDNPENQNFKIEKSTWRYYLFRNLHCKWQSYDVWFLRYGAQQTEFFGPRKSKFWKNQKTPADIIILQMFTINDSHMYGS